MEGIKSEKEKQWVRGEKNHTDASQLMVGLCTENILSKNAFNTPKSLTILA